MEDMRYLTFALGKGRLAKKTLELFEKIGITCEEMKDKDTSVLSGRIPYWRRDAISTKSWISGLENAGCASADRRMRKSC